MRRVSPLKKLFPLADYHSLHPQQITYPLLLAQQFNQLDFSAKMNFFEIGINYPHTIRRPVYNKNSKHKLKIEGRGASDAIVRIVRILKFNTYNIQKQENKTL